MTGEGLAGIAVANDRVYVVDRDPADKNDLFRCFDAQSGASLWVLERPSAGRLDYGNSPRATPLVYRDFVYFLSAFGRLHAVNAKSGEIVWSKNLRTDFGPTEDLIWGTASSPLIVDDLLIINPGAPKASIVALDPATGATKWQTPGGPSAFCSFVVRQTKEGAKQIIGMDKVSIGAWDAATGKRLWTLPSVDKGEFNVPTPIVMQDAPADKLIITTEVGGTRIYDLNGDKINPKPTAENFDLAPDSHSPVLTHNRVFGVWQSLYCLDAKKGLETIWTSDDLAYSEYATVLASPTRVLVTTQLGDVILVDATADKYTEQGRWKIWPKEAGLYSHPAIAGNYLYLRSSRELVCIDLTKEG